MCCWLGYFCFWIHRISSFHLKQQCSHSPTTFSIAIYWLWYWFIWMQWRFHNKCIKARWTNYGRFRIIIPIYCSIGCLPRNKIIRTSKSQIIQYGSSWISQLTKSCNILVTSFSYGCFKYYFVPKLPIWYNQWCKLWCWNWQSFNSCWVWVRLSVRVILLHLEKLIWNILGRIRLCQNHGNQRSW